MAEITAVDSKEKRKHTRHLIQSMALLFVMFGVSKGISLLQTFIIAAVVGISAGSWGLFFLTCFAQIMVWVCLAQLRVDFTCYIATAMGSLWAIGSFFVFPYATPVASAVIATIAFATGFVGNFVALWRLRHANAVR